MTGFACDKNFLCPDWNQPIFAGVAEVLPHLRLLSSWPELEFFNELATIRALTLPCGRALRFVLQPKKRSRWRRRAGAGEAVAPARYDQSVLERGEIPTRLRSWHDLFNNISWLLFPEAKTALVERLAGSYLTRTQEDIERAQFRSREGDRLAILDEGGVILVQVGDEQRTFVFGHALQESYVYGRLNIRCMSVMLTVPAESKASDGSLVAATDRALAAFLRDGGLSSHHPAVGEIYLEQLCVFGLKS